MDDVDLTPEQVEATRALLGVDSCWGCGADIANALVACPTCLDRLPPEERNPLFAIGRSQDEQRAAVDSARGWLYAHPVPSAEAGGG